MANKHALLVGCNYPGTSAALKGCINDVWSMKQVLVTHKGFPEENIKIMIDTDNRYERPTGGAVKRALAALINSGNAGDVLFFHFSGHGTQIPAEGYDDEPDGKDEAICPTDLNIIVDDDLREIVEKLHPGVDFTFVADCCHSGGLLDHAQVQITGGGSGGGGGGPSLMDLMGAIGAAPHGRDFEVKNRELPIGMLCQMLSQQSGTRVQPGNIKMSLANMFGGDASKLCVGFLSAVQGQIQTAAAGQRSSGGSLAMLAAVIGMLVSCMKKGQQAAGGQQQMQQAQQGQYPAGFEPPRPPGSKPPKPDQLSDEKGILISGCQSHETSADACPSGDPSKAFGALSNAICTVVNKHPDITFYQLVTEVRKYLQAGRYSQNPCLECTTSNSQKPFICPSFVKYSDI